MSQSVTSSFAAENAKASKKVDYAFVIAGSPTVYTVARNDYTLAGELANFTSIHTWADLPVCSGAAQKGRPEEGGLTIGQANVSVLDRRANGVRKLSDLLSRRSYLETYTGKTNVALLTSDITNDQTTIGAAPINSAWFPATGGLLYIGQECIKYGSHNGSSFLSCERGHLGTSPTPHYAFYSAPTDWQWVNIGKYFPAWIPMFPTGRVPLTVAFPFLPSVLGRRATIYKGYQDLPMSDWARAFSGIIVGAEKRGPAVTFSIMSSTWSFYGDGRPSLSDRRTADRGPSRGDPMGRYASSTTC